MVEVLVPQAAGELDHVRELMRAFVAWHRARHERFRGLGVGVALSERVLADARSLGYRRMRLDTSIRQAEAIGLYRRFGFVPIEPYYELADDLRGWLVFMELEL
jgi:ribosomal protein S18 acetylase RimI-like enzyme